MKKRALVSVSDKTGIVDFCKFLHSIDVEIVSTGGTAKELSAAGIPVTPAEKITGNPDAFGGRMKTISFQVGSALLYRKGHPEDERQANELGIQRIDFLVCNLYPFDRVVRTSKDIDEWIENIDIGGPTMIRAAAKNHAAVCVITNPVQYSTIQQEWKKNHSVSLETRRQLAIGAFQSIASYDLRIAGELTKAWSPNLRYGENPHQKAVLIPLENTTDVRPLASAKIHQGKELSYNNWLDVDQAFKLCSALNEGQGPGSSTACVIVKHGTPCGVAQNRDPLQAVNSAMDSDKISAFGGIVALSSLVTESIAKRLSEIFLEVLIAPEYTPEALKIFQTKKNLRILEVPLKKENSGEWTARSIHGGLLIQDEDEPISSEIRSVTSIAVSPDQHELIRFGLKVTKYLKSNCIAICAARNGGFSTVVSGVGQPNRLECITKLIVSRIEENHLNIEGGVLFSDAFFPFRDSIEACEKLGVKTIIQPGGSIRDSEVIAACNEYGIAMAFTDMRHFRH